MPLLFLILSSFWMEFLEHKTEFFCFLSIIEGTYVVVNSVDDDLWEAEIEQTGALNEEVESWDLLCL